MDDSTETVERVLREAYQLNCTGGWTRWSTIDCCVVLILSCHLNWLYGFPLVLLTGATKANTFITTHFWSAIHSMTNLFGY
jgi:hypothetical protein